MDDIIKLAPPSSKPHRVKSVLEILDIVLSRAEWADLNRRHSANLPYPFADVVPIMGAETAPAPSTAD